MVLCQAVVAIIPFLKIRIKVSFYYQMKKYWGRKAWLGARIMFHIKDKLPKNTFIYSDHFEKKCFDASWKVWSELFYKNRQINRRQVKGSVPFIFCYREQLVVCESSKQMIDKREKKEVAGIFSLHILSSCSSFS